MDFEANRRAVVFKASTIRASDAHSFTGAQHRHTTLGPANRGRRLDAAERQTIEQWRRGKQSARVPLAPARAFLFLCLWTPSMARAARGISVHGLDALPARDVCCRLAHAEGRLVNSGGLAVEVFFAISGFYMSLILAG